MTSRSITTRSTRSRLPAGLTIIALAAALLPALAQAAPDPAALIRQAVDNQVFNLKAAEIQIAMLLRNKQGEKKERRMQTITLQQNGLNKTVTRFVAPPDVARTAFLFIENKGRDDDQYMYLPAINVVRRIVGSQKDASFMGSDFTYADLESRDHDEASHKLTGSEKLGGSDCYVIESKPRAKTYTKLVSWVRKSDNVFLRVQYFDKKGELLKVLFTKEVKTLGTQKVLTRFKLSNKQTGHSTVIAVTALKMREDLKADEFTERALKKR